MLFEQKVGVKGVVDCIQVINPDGSIDREIGPFKNVILDQGLPEFDDYMIGEYQTMVDYEDVPSGLMGGIVIGVGDTTPSETDNGLENQKGSTLPNASYDRWASFPAAGTTPYEFEIGVTHETDKGELDSSTDGTYKEIGFISASGGDPGVVITRTLIKDSNGDPTTLSVASDQKLRITYKFLFTAALDSPTSASFDITNIGTINYTHQLCEISSGYRANGSRISKALEPHTLYSSNGGWWEARVKLFKVDRTQTVSWPDIGNWNDLGGIITDEFGEKNLDSQSTSMTSTGVWDTDIFYGTGAANGIRIDGIMLYGEDSNGSETGAHWAALFDEADAFTKDDLHELTITFRLSYVRT